MKDIPITVKPEILGTAPLPPGLKQEKANVYMIKCPVCGEHGDTPVRFVSESWDLGFVCEICGLIFTADYR